MGILRYEIKEMIQKIKLLQTELSGAMLEQEDTQLQQVRNYDIEQEIMKYKNFIEFL